MAKNLFIFDLDGTLISPSSQYPNLYTQKAIIEASKFSDVIIATARPLFGISHILADVKKNIHGFIFLNGAIIEFQNEISYSNPIPFSFINFILDINIRIDNLWFYSSDNWFVNTKNSIQYKNETKAVQKDGRKLEDYNFDLIYKIIIISRNINEILELISNENISTSFSNKNYLEITSNNVTKLIGIKEIIGKDKYTNIFSIGDSFNDIPFLEYSTYSCTIQNGHPKIKSIVDYISDKSFDEGCIDCIEHIKLILNKG